MNTIVVGYDGSHEARRAFDRSAELAEALAAKLVVVSVSRSPFVPAAVPVIEPEIAYVPSPVGGPMPSGALPPLPPEQRVEPKEFAERQLEDARLTLAGRAVEAEYVAEAGTPAERLLEIAEERGADLIVVGSREHGLLERVLHRPVEETVARHAGRDVLLVH